MAPDDSFPTHEGAVKLLPKVSLMMISYNQKEFIREALEGAISQDYANLEVVVSDDGSTDGTQEIIAEYQERYPHRLIALLNKDNVGITRNSNRALRACAGKYIAFQGGDDILLPEKVSRQVEWFEADPARVLCGHYVEVFYEDHSRSPHLAPRRLVQGAGADLLIRHGGLFTAMSTMVAADKIPPHGFDEALPVVSDYMLAIEVLASGGVFGYVEGVLARYRRHSNNVTASYIKHVGDVEKTLKIVCDRYPQYRRSCSYAMARHVICPQGIHWLNQGNKDKARAKFLDAIRMSPGQVGVWMKLLRAL
jgi:glycosyltransferase involved in cell wall biosynthesis